MKPVSFLLNRLPNAKEKESSSLIKLVKLANGKVQIKILTHKTTSVKDIFLTLYSSVAENSI